ncbi:aldo/keto reductase [Desulfopila sp. IMCC35008]|uniref:aldo/keto reductase family protein n=1 Tax=Desulfopila sp. IMCC35008 TaxID=2653858 RepID=UPI0013D5543B|nr:aldo/keto reductase [Desulfopila sp. IMCC35008]
MEITKNSRNRIEMPLVGYGTYQLSTMQAETCVAEALKAGFRHIDSAEGYNNEEGTGKGIKASGLSRDEVFVTTKLFPGYEKWGSKEKNYKQSIATLKEQLKTLQLDYVDLYLIHAPFASLRLEQWNALIDLRKQGLAKHIGVSNYSQERLEEIMDADLPMPEANQVEFHPICAQTDLTNFMQNNSIEPVGYSSLAPLSTWRIEDGQGGEVLSEIKTECQNVTRDVAEKLKVSEAKVLLRWGLQRGYAVLTKSSKPSRIRENLELFDFFIPEDDMSRLNTLDLQRPMAWAANGVDPMEIAAQLK